jgi:hypothetical protein
MLKLSPERYQKLCELFDAACDLAPEKQAEFVAENCQGDPEMAGELTSLLEADGDPLEFLTSEAAEAFFRGLTGKSRRELYKELEGRLHRKILDKIPDDGPKH